MCGSDFVYSWGSYIDGIGCYLDIWYVIKNYLFFIILSKYICRIFLVNLLLLFVLGGNGYINDYLIGRFLRDVKLYEIGVGISEVRRLIIGRVINVYYK